jgi:hypothetical protein
MCGSNEDDVTEDWRNGHNEEHHSCAVPLISSRRWDVQHKQQKWKMYKYFGKSHRKKQPERSRYRKKIGLYWKLFLRKSNWTSGFYEDGNVWYSFSTCLEGLRTTCFLLYGHYNPAWVLAPSIVFVTISFFRGRVVSPTPMSQPGGVGTILGLFPTLWPVWHGWLYQ